MNKVKKFIKGIGLLIRNPWLMNKVLDDAEVNSKEVIQKYNLEKGLPTANLLDLCPDFNETVNPYSFLDGGSTTLDLALLKCLARKFSPCDYFEIGTWRGESVANVAQVASSCFTLNLPDDEMRRLGLDEKYIQLHRYFSKSLNNVTHLQHNSMTFDFLSLNKKFDLIFIDGDHHYESVCSDTANAFKLLKDENSIIVWHDYGNTPADIRWDVLKGILDGTPEEERKYLYRVSNTLCAIYTRSELNSYYPSAHITPDKVFTVHLLARQIGKN